MTNLADLGIREISLKEFDGICIGHAEDSVGVTGCTVLAAKEGMAAAVDVRGGGPASRETTLLDPLSSAESIHAIVLSGGSAFGLDAASGVMEYLEENGIGFDTGFSKVPLVCQSCIYDLGIGSSSSRPDKAMGYEACKNAFQVNDGTQMGNVGAGIGATVGKARGAQSMMKSGLGIYCLAWGELKVGAVAVVNALGDIYDYKTQKKIAGMRNLEGSGFQDCQEELLRTLARQEGDNLFTSNTTIGVIITNGNFNKMQLKRVCSASHNAYARTIRPVHTSADGDSIYAVCAGKRVSANVDMVSILAEEAMAMAVNQAVYSAQSWGEIPAARDFHAADN